MKVREDVEMKWEAITARYEPKETGKKKRKKKGSDMKRKKT